MKNGTKYAKLMKDEFKKLLKQESRPTQPEPTDPLDQLLLGILARGATETQAIDAMKKINEATVDRNELRVAAPRELLELWGKQFPAALDKARSINEMLNAVFDREHNLDLKRLRDMKKSDARDYLLSLPGTDPHTVASTMLLSIGGHAIPVDDTMLAYFRQQNLVDPDANVSEVQAFLERNVAAADGYAFYAMMRSHAARGLARTGDAKNAPAKSSKNTAGKTTARKPAAASSTPAGKPASKAPSKPAGKKTKKKERP